jgi:hypothetical protein
MSKALDPGLQQIADLERDIVRAHDEKQLLGVSADEVARQRSAVVALAERVCAILRAEYLARMKS